MKTDPVQRPYWFNDLLNQGFSEKEIYFAIDINGYDPDLVLNFLLDNMWSLLILIKDIATKSVCWVNNFINVQIDIESINKEIFWLSFWKINWYVE